jgi:hypothetical protein
VEATYRSEYPEEQSAAHRLVAQRTGRSAATAHDLHDRRDITARVADVEVAHADENRRIVRYNSTYSYECGEANEIEHLLL